MFNLGKDKERTIVRDKNSIADKSIPKQVTNDVISVRIVFSVRGAPHFSQINKGNRRAEDKGK